MELLIVLLLVLIILGVGATAKLAWWMLIAFALAVVIGYGLSVGRRR